MDGIGLVWSVPYQGNENLSVILSVSTSRYLAWILPDLALREMYLITLSCYRRRGVEKTRSRRTRPLGLFSIYRNSDCLVVEHCCLNPLCTRCVTYI